MAVAIITERYADFGPTLATEKLAELHELHVSKETVRKWMIEAGLWKTKAARRRIYQPRNRRDCLGELIQIDGSLHHWFEDRGAKCALIVFIDDATSSILHLRFCPSESTFDYMAAFRTYVGEHGKPIAFYSEPEVRGAISTRSSGRRRPQGWVTATTAADRSSGAHCTS